MLNFSPEKLLLVGFIALIVLGPHRLPEAARSLGRMMAQLRRMSASFQDEVRDALAEPTEAFRSAAEDFRVPSVRQTARDTFTSVFAPPASATPPPAGPSAGPVTSVGNGSGPPAPDDPSLN